MDYKVQKNSQNNDMASLVNDVCNIIETGRKEAYVAAGKSAVITYWNIGRRIVKEEQQGKERAEYGAEVIKNLALKIIPRYGASYNKRNLDYYKRFYLLFPDIQRGCIRIKVFDTPFIFRLHENQINLKGMTFRDFSKLFYSQGVKLDKIAKTGQIGDYFPRFWSVSLFLSTFVVS